MPLANEFARYIKAKSPCGDYHESAYADFAAVAREFIPKRGDALSY